MPSYRTHKELKNRWHARAKRDDIEFSLGYFHTKEEALNAELKFAESYPPKPMGRRDRGVITNT